MSSTVDGLLDIEVVRAPDGRTRVESVRQHFPQRITAPMYPDPAAPDAAYLCVQNPTGGVFPGDRLRTNVTVHPGAHLMLTSQSATAVYASPEPDEPRAEHRAELTVHDGGVLEHPQQTTIPHRRSRFHQSTRIALLGDAVYLGWEVLAPGRIGHGERFAYGCHRSSTVVAWNGTDLTRDVTLLEPDEHDADAPGVLGGRDYFATMFALAPARPGEHLAKRWNDTLREHRDVLAAASSLDGGLGAVARVLAGRAPTARAALRHLWAVARRELLDLDPPSPRLP